MADVSLNELKTKTDSLPNDWLVSLINPKGGEPAEIMTVAKFIELLFEKVPKAVKYNNIASIDFTTEAGYGYSTAGWLYTGPILKFGTSDGYNVHIQGEPNNNRLSMRGVYNESYKPWKTFAFLEDISNIISSPTANSLTEASPVLESRQVRSTCLLSSTGEQTSQINLSAESSISNSSSDLSGQEGENGSTPVRTEPSEAQEQYVWSIDKIGRAVLELQAENKRLKQILNISDDSEVQQM